MRAPAGRAQRAYLVADRRHSVAAYCRKAPEGACAHRRARPLPGREPVLNDDMHAVRRGWRDVSPARPPVAGTPMRAAEHRAADVRELVILACWTRRARQLLQQ